MPHTRLAVFPSRANHVLYKQKIASAVRGFNFLKRKRDALEFKLNENLRELSNRSEKMNALMHEAIIQVAKAKFIGFDTLPLMYQNMDEANLSLNISYNNVAGVHLPILQLNSNEVQPFPLTGLGRGGQQVANIRVHFEDAVKELVEIASLEFSTKILMIALHQTKLRVNGLEFVIIPKFQATLKYISDEIDEYSREEFYRLKQSQKKHQKVYI